MNNKIDINYLNYDDLNTIENEIYRITNLMKSRYESEIPIFEKKTWVLNELPFINLINRIETGVYNLGYYIIQPSGWIPCKLWLETEDSVKSYDYADWNRWVNDLQLADNITEELTLWNGKSLIDWNLESSYEWEEE